MTDDQIKSRIIEIMNENGFSTGHGDTVEELLDELAWQVIELRKRIIFSSAQRTINLSKTC